jgi:cytosine/adenosine deaminase-related metal-dependent hydrolase
LERFGLLDERCLLAHGIHLESADYANIAKHGAVLVHNPESNEHNRVGRLDTASAARQGCLVGLGTDGMSSAMLRALRAALLVFKSAAKSGCATAVSPELLFNNVQVARRFFDEPLLGELAPGALADIIVVDVLSPPPVVPENLMSHLIFGASESPVRHTIARGRVLLEDFSHRTLDPAELAARARELTPGLWRRFAALKCGTQFLGS